MIIELWDNGLKQYRQFTVIPYDVGFKPSCREPMHQFVPKEKLCTCKRFSRS